MRNILSEFQIKNKKALIPLIINFVIAFFIGFDIIREGLNQGFEVFDLVIGGLMLLSLIFSITAIFREKNDDMEKKAKYSARFLLLYLFLLPFLLILMFTIGKIKL